MPTDKKLNFILSTGRTGTMFFEEYINSTSTDAICLHEPRPSRRFIPLSNMFFQKKIDAKAFDKLYSSARRSLWSSMHQSIYIESSNFMWAGVKALNEAQQGIRVLHIVRHPQDYIKSHYDYGFWKHYKQFIRKYVPFFMEDLPLSSAQKKDPIMVLAARWKLINEHLATYAHSNPYLCVKFEELFGGDAAQGATKLGEIREFFGLKPLSTEETVPWLSSPKNTSPKRPTGHLIDAYSEYIESELSGLMGIHGYSLKAAQQ